jgi:hypothetical protein
VNTLCLPNKIGIVGANNDARVIGLRLVKINKIPAIDRKHDARFGNRKGNNSVSGIAWPALSALQSLEEVMIRNCEDYLKQAADERRN